MEEKKKKVVVAFSGGLDTSFTVMYLAKEKGYEVYAACANTGGFSEEQLKQNEENAYKLGAVKYVTLDVTREYYEKSLKYMVFGNVLRNGTYPISVSSERIFQGLAIARYANEIGADAIAHGSTGAGNDQIRFDMTFLVLAPGVEIITLTRDMALSRQQEIDYLNEHGFAADFTKLKYSYNVGLWGTSICGGEILDSAQGLPESAYLKQVTKEGSEQLRLTFEKGELKAVNDEKFDDPIKAIQKVEEIGAPYGIGRDMHEDPEVPNYGRKGTGPILKNGMCIAIEPMVNMGKRNIVIEKDGWTCHTRDRQPSAHYEHTVAIIGGETEILTTFEYIEEVLGDKAI